MTIGYFEKKCTGYLLVSILLLILHNATCNVDVTNIKIWLTRPKSSSSTRLAEKR